MATSGVPSTDAALAELEQVRREHGDWTAMSIHLGNGLHTLEPRPDHRLLRLLQVTSDLVDKPLDQIRVLDLACLEGQYAIEFALHGAEAVGIELRSAHVARAELARRQLGLTRVSFRLEDVRSLALDVHGEFDVVICSGILYHLDVPDVFEFVRRCFEVCTRLAIFDTHIALAPRDSVQYASDTYHGLWYREHAEDADRETRLRNLWASVDNTRAFWFTEASLCNLMAKVGFSSFYECLDPYVSVGDDRRTYIAVKGHGVEVRSSPMTNEVAAGQRPEYNALPVDPIQGRRGGVTGFLRAHLPKRVKSVAKRLRGTERRRPA
jgi:SAM-dependent methyltransferase